MKKTSSSIFEISTTIANYLKGFWVGLEVLPRPMGSLDAADKTNLWLKPSRFDLQIPQGEKLHLLPNEYRLEFMLQNLAVESIYDSELMPAIRVSQIEKAIVSVIGEEVEIRTNCHHPWGGVEPAYFFKISGSEPMLQSMFWIGNELCLSLHWAFSEEQFSRNEFNVEDHGYQALDESDLEQRVEQLMCMDKAPQILLEIVSSINDMLEAEGKMARTHSDQVFQLVGKTFYTRKEVEQFEEANEIIFKPTSKFWNRCEAQK